MENTRKRLYIISFGGSRKYRLLIDPKARDHSPRSLAPLAYYEKELNDYLAQCFPGETFAYFTTPKVEEVYVSHADRYASLPEFDERVLDDIKKLLVKEIKEMSKDKVLGAA